MEPDAAPSCPIRRRGSSPSNGGSRVFSQKRSLKRASLRDLSDFTDEDLETATGAPAKGDPRFHGFRHSSIASGGAMKRSSMISPSELRNYPEAENHRKMFLSELGRFGMQQENQRLLAVSTLLSSGFSSSVTSIGGGVGGDINGVGVSGVGGEIGGVGVSGSVVDGTSSVTVEEALQKQQHEGGRCRLNRHRISRVRPLHVCAAHSFLCFRDNGDLLAVTPQAVLVYDRPPAACELSYKEPLYSIPISDVSRAADLSESSVIALRRGSFQDVDRSADELIVAEVASGETRLLARIALPLTALLMVSTTSRSRQEFRFPMLYEKSSRRDGVECRGMQVNQTEHKVYLLYDYHLVVVDLDMQLEPLVVSLSCRSEELGPAVALIEFDHALYILTAKSYLLASSKTRLFSLEPGSCCLPVLLKFDARLCAQEVRSSVVDRRHATAFFSVPRGCKIVSLAFPVPKASHYAFDAAFVEVTEGPLLQERLYSTASCTDWSAAVPCSLAWDASTEQLLVLEWGSENDGVLVSVDFWPDEDGIRNRRQMYSGLRIQLLDECDRFQVVKTFRRSN